MSSGFDDDIFRITPLAIDINDTRGVRAADMTSTALSHMEKKISLSRVLVCGASYRQDVGDTRYSGSEIIVRRLAELGAKVTAHDPYVKSWPELADQHSDPHGKMKFFENQDQLSSLEVNSDLKDCLSGVDAILLAVPHSEYCNLDPDDLLQEVGSPFAIIDCLLKQWLIHQVNGHVINIISHHLSVNFPIYSTQGIKNTFKTSFLCS